MYKIRFKNIENRYNYEELIKEFLGKDEFEIVEDDSYDICFNEDNSNDRYVIEREIYNKLSALTNTTQDWGIITGVRPSKLFKEKREKLGSVQAVREELKEKYLLTQNKIDLLTVIHNFQRVKLGEPKDNSVSIYIGIPFCPTRCLYCSFTSNQQPDSEIKRYLEALKKEIKYVGEKVKEKGLYIESVYVGGGTPTTLNEKELNDLLAYIFKHFDLKNVKEFTLEAGRPDTITKKKLKIIRKYGIKRISINPQTMKDETLKIIGRHHTSGDIFDAFKLATDCGIEIINCDLIMGLPGETLDDFKDTLNKIFLLNPTNITVHTLAVKKASKLYELDEKYSFKEANTVKEMIKYGEDFLKESGYIPYYIYRQKNMAGNLENVGWCTENTIGVYNVRIMEERQHILALGAGGISKVYFKDENRLERVPNVSNYEVYIDRIDEMIKRKEDNFFSVI